MSATFSQALPSDRDRARLLLGDVPEGAVSGTVADALLQDETIDAVLGSYPFNEAVRQLAVSLVSRFGAEPDRYEEGNGLRLEWRNRLDAWKALIKELKDTPASSTRSRPGIAIGAMAAPDLTNMRTD